jgi:hypothetical protein
MLSTRNWDGKKFLTILVLLLLVNLPVISALEISSINAEDITENQATIIWETDEPADSFVNYGVDKGGLQTTGDAKKTTNHELNLNGLLPDTEYYYSVESDDLVEDNSGDLYSFKTNIPDTTAPALVVELPELVAGTKMDITGWTEIGSQVNLFVNGNFAGNAVAIKDEESFQISSNVDSTEPTADEEVEVTEEMPNVKITEDEVSEEPAQEEVPVEEEVQVEEEPVEETTEPVQEETEDLEVNATEAELEAPETDAIAGQAIFDGEEIETPEGVFTFVNVVINKEGPTEILIEAVDPSGNKGSFTGQVYSDNIKPTLKLINVSEIVDGSSIELEGTFSENVTYEIIIGNKSVSQGEGTELKESISLEEGDNEIKIVAVDVAGWELTETIEIYADTQIPTVTMEIEKGNEYYQGRAVSSINGETEAGATVYLYVYRPIGYDYAPDFKRAQKKITADQNGTFTFKAVDFESEPVILEDLAPKEVPQGLQEYAISSVNVAEDQQRWTYYVFVIAEDKLGKLGYSQATVTVNTCYSADWDFDVRSLPEFQRPMRLDPGLLDEGREQVTAVFNLSYRGGGYSQTNVLSGSVDQSAYVINSVQFDKACTQSMMDDPQFRLGCSIMTNNPNKIPNVDNSAWYLTYKLNSAEKLSETDDDYWNEFKKRQIMFPMKIRINYQERGVDGNLGATKTQTSCYDLSYFVDIPLDSKNMLPDWLADEGMDAIDFTIKQIDTILPYLQKAILVTGIGCISSFLGRMVVRWSRIFTSKLEVYFTRLNEDDKKCPTVQGDLYLKSTIEHWQGLGDAFFETESKPRGKEWDQKILDDKCPMTAGAWKLEAGLDQAYRWTCDRVFCREVPAGWTASKDKEEVDTVILSQQRCTASSRGIPLLEVEGCKDKVTQDVTNPSAIVQSRAEGGDFTCYRYNGQMYFAVSNNEPTQFGRVVRLRKIHDFGINIKDAAASAGYSDLLAYQPPGSEQFIIGQDQSCANACNNPRKPGYAADTTGGISNYRSQTATVITKNGCYREVKAEGRVGTVTDLKDAAGNLMGGNKFSAGYTSDCFIDFEPSGDTVDAPKAGWRCTESSDCSSDKLICVAETCMFQDPSAGGKIKLNVGLLDGKNTGTSSATGLLQCVCTVDEDAEEVYGARTAAKEKNVGGETKSEDWVYRQSEVFKESRSLFGTYYPTWRYYGGRDFSSAFGADYLIDYTKSNKTVATVSPNKQFLGAYQTVCLSVIRGHLVMLKSILEGLRNCIEQAKHTGLTDAGVCKTIFAQHVCGLVYKAIAYFFTGCSPYSMADEKKDSVVGAIGEVFSSGLGSIGESMESSISDIKSDYGNAKLNQFFATGARGFTESICMFAFGYDWPLGMDFILDSAYAVEMKSTVMVFPAERELATFNPAKGTAVYNYNIGALVLPGCEIKSADVYLKCVGQEDQGHPGVQCGSQGCNCLHATESSGVESEKVRHLESGRLFDLKQGSFTDLKIPSPQKVDSSYRYDHVVVDLKLGPYSDPANCFDEGYRDGKFYYPIVDVSPPAEFVCEVYPSSGRFLCPEVQKIFGNGNGGYLEDPYITCYNQDMESFGSCDVPNLFTKGKSIRLKAHTFTDGEPYCLRVTTDGLGPDRQLYDTKPLPKNIPGPYGIEMNLGTVTPELFSGTYNSLTLTSDSDQTCSRQVKQTNYPTGQVVQTSYSFTYTKQPGSGLYLINIGSAITAAGDYQNDGGVLKQRSSGKTQFTGIELQKIGFSMGGFLVSGLIGSPTGQTGMCKYRVGQAAGDTYAKDIIPITVKVEMLMSENGNCFNANIPIKAPAFGKQQASKTFNIQLEPIASQVTSRMHQEFMEGNCQYVQDNAKQIINRVNNDGSVGKADLAEAVALYYSVSCYIVDAAKVGQSWQTSRKNEICTLLDIFFNRNYAVIGKKAADYPSEVKNTNEFVKIEKYLNEVKSKLNCNQDLFPSLTPSSTPTPVTSGVTTCGHPQAQFKIESKSATWKPTNWNAYVCKKSVGNSARDPDNPALFDYDKFCFDRGMYSDQDLANSLGVTFGCPGVQLCCPPSAS